MNSEKQAHSLTRNRPILMCMDRNRPILMYTPMSRRRLC